MKKILPLIVFALLTTKIFASCPPGFSEVIVKIIPDSYYYEVSWNITDSLGNIIAQADSSAGDTICLPSGSCHMFSIFDSFGDGIFNPGGFWLYTDGNLVANGAAFGHGTQYSFNCLPGTFCTGPLPLTLGSHTAQFDDTWYDYTPTVSGTYLLTTCGLNTCDTKIWMYTTCPTIPYLEGVQGTFAFNDSNNCGTQAVLRVVLTMGTHYLVRVGDNNDSCTGSINFDFSYVGPIEGCMDHSACNFNPLAVVDDSSCIYFPSPLCEGPDLHLDSAMFVSSLSLHSHTATNCDVAEGCVTDYGTRWVVEFTSHIDNIGTQDFYIGNATTQPGMFNTVNCHGHAHYEGYGDYILFDMNDHPVPAGHKNGYCVIDLCGHGQYTCGNMGISAGCYDAYGAGTQCQWIDITDVPTGDYRIAVIINSKHLPDALGRYETNYANNAVQVCMHIVHNTTGAPTYTILPNCVPYIDCTGIPGGSSEIDCNGVCNGPDVYGDMFQDNRLDSLDVDTYLGMIQSGMPANNCNDLNRDNNLSVYDVALINWCRRQNPLHPAGSVHNHCNFPRNILNPNNTVGLTISNVDLVHNYVDVSILNPNANVKAYQFTMSGITVSNVVTLANPVYFPVDLRIITGTNEIFAISPSDSSLSRFPIAQPLVRIYFSAITDSAICISSITDIVNQDGERTLTNIFGGCVTPDVTVVPSIIKQADLVLIPNPATDKAYIHLSTTSGSINELVIMDIAGKKYSVPNQMIRDSWYEMDLRLLPPGVYIVSLRNNNAYGIVRIVKL